MRGLLPKERSWTNACPARAVFTTSFYRPTRHAPRVRGPVLLVMAKRDEVIAPSSVKKSKPDYQTANLLRSTAPISIPTKARASKRPS